MVRLRAWRYRGQVGLKTDLRSFAGRGSQSGPSKDGSVFDAQLYTPSKSGGKTVTVVPSASILIAGWRRLSARARLYASQMWFLPLLFGGRGGIHSGVAVPTRT